MAVYFQGRKLIAVFNQVVEDGRGRLDWDVFEEWIDIDQSTTARCGMPGSCTVEKSVGVSEKTSQTLKGVIGAAFGVKDVWTVKAEVEKAIGREVNWDTAVKSTKTFQFQAPKCGRYSLTVFRLQRLYQVSYLRKKWFSWGADRWEWKWTRTFTEDTHTHDAIPDVEEEDPVCRCPRRDEPQRFDGNLAFDFGSISFRAPYRLTGQGFDVQIGNKVIAVSMAEPALVARSLEHGLAGVLLSTALIPEPLRFLGDVEAKELEARVRRVPDAEFVGEDGLELVMGQASVVEERMQRVHGEPLEG